MASDYFLQFTEKALSDLDEITDYLINTLGQRSAAQRFVDQIDQETQMICRYPESGTLVLNEFVKYSNIRKLVIEKYVLYYISDGENQRITVLRIAYGKRDLEAIIKDFA